MSKRFDENENEKPLTVTVKQAAAMLNVSVVTVYRLIYRRVLIPVPGIRHKRIPRWQVEKLANGK